MIDKAAIIRELQAMIPQPYNPDTDITAAEAVAVLGCSDSKSAMAKLRELVAAGKLREVDNVKLSNGKVGRVWRVITAQ